MLRTLIPLVGLGLAVVAAGLAVGRTGGRAAVGPVLAGVAVAFAAFLLVDCRQCAAGALYVGALLSLPFAAVGWLVLLFDREGLSGGAALVVRAAAGFQAAWAAMITVTATMGGSCPCSAFGWGDPAIPLRAVGTDRLVGPVLLAVAAVTLLLAGAARRRARAA